MSKEYKEWIPPWWWIVFSLLIRITVSIIVSIMTVCMVLKVNPLNLTIELIKLLTGRL